MVSRGTRATVGAPVPAAALTSLDLAGHVRDKLPVQKRDDYLELEAWLADGDDEVLTANRAQLKDFIARGSFGTTEREYVHSALLRLFTKKFASCSMSWAGAKGNKEFTLKTSKVWELLNDVVSAKFPDFQKNMGVHFNKFHKDVGKEATRSGISGCGRSAGGDGDRPHAAAGGVGVGVDNSDKPALPADPCDDLLEGSVEEVETDEQQIPDVQSEDVL